MRFIYRQNLKIKYLFFDIILPLCYFYFNSKKLWINESSENFEFYFAKHSRAHKEKNNIIDQYEKNFTKLNEEFKYAKDQDRKIIVCCFPTNKLSLKINNRKLNFVRLKENKIFIIYNYLVTASPLHELTHVLTYKYFGAIDSNIKKLLFEGLAVAVTHSARVHRIYINKTKGKVFQLADIINGKVPLDIFYFGAGSFVLFLAKTFGLKSLLNICGKPDFEKHFNTDIKVLEKCWLESLRNSTINNDESNVKYVVVEKRTESN